MGLYQNRIVVKVGTSTLTNEMGKSDLRSFDRLACVLSDIQNMGYEVILVSSGAIAVGTNKLNMKEHPSSMRMKQAAAAVGQCSMMFLYDKFFNDYDKTIAQILLNAEDMEQEEKKENLINTFNALLEMDIIPVVNENDSVSYTEIESEDRLFGDNDMLSAVVVILGRAKQLVILSDINGLYDADPRLYPNAPDRSNRRNSICPCRRRRFKAGNGRYENKTSSRRVSDCTGNRYRNYKREDAGSII